MFKRVPGTKDILTDEVYLWQKIEEVSRSVFSLYNFREIRPPVIEYASLFNRSLGEFTEIVQKQMFLVRNQEDIYALRPEGTASIVRAYIENNLDKKGRFAKFYYIGPMFRLERPQKGRLRQFHHVGCEVIGSASPEIDVEVISLADKLLKSYSISGYKIKLNSLGCTEDKKKLTAILKEGLKNKLSGLCADCNARFNHNILRILDCKEKACRQIVEGLNLREQYICPDCAGHFSEVTKGLDALKISYEISPHLVRGLDYYTRTVFEISQENLGAQDAVGAGGRYDNLVAELGGPQLPAIGFAFGVERLLLAMNSPGSETGLKNLVFVITLGDEARAQGLKLLQAMRDSAIPSDTDYEEKSLKGAMRLANDSGARFVVIIGENELKNNAVMLKDMSSGTQKEVKTDGLIAELKAAIC